MLPPSSFPEFEYVFIEDSPNQYYDWDSDSEQIFENWVDEENEWWEAHGEELS